MATTLNNSEKSSTSNNKQPKKKKQKQSKPPLSLTRRLFETLLDCDELHIPSTLTEKYRNKITYSIPLPSPLSILAQDDVNQVCENVAAFQSANSSTSTAVTFREVMVKTTRTGSVLVRITVQKTTSTTADANDATAAASWKDTFVEYMCQQCPSLECLCYNETETTARPTKDDPLHLLFGKKHVFESTPPPNPLSYQLSPDTFCEINHEVERLQYDQAKAWLLQYCCSSTTTKVKAKQQQCGGTTTESSSNTLKKRQTLLVSGRDVSSFGLGFGCLRDERNNNEKIFDDVLAVQHCPLVHADAVANFELHSKTVKAAVFHKSKKEMVAAIHGHCCLDTLSDDEDTVQQRQTNDNNNNHVLVGVMTGGRKGLDPSYLNYLVSAKHLKAIIYNSCSTKSLVRDMEGLLKAFIVQDFRSYNFFPGTSFTASLTLLVRRPTKTLIIPVGPAGAGKSCLANNLVEGGLNDLTVWQRDVVFSKLREQGIGLNKTKHQVHQDLLSFLSSHTDGILYVDSTNGNEEARQLYVTEAKASRVIYIVFPMLEGIDEEAILQWLLDRTRHRLGDNSDNHPGFPDSKEEQRTKHVNILKGIVYPNNVNGVSSGCEVLSCDPKETLALRSFRVFVRISSGKSVIDALL